MKKTSPAKVLGKSNTPVRKVATPALKEVTPNKQPIKKSPSRIDTGKKRNGQSGARNGNNHETNENQNLSGSPGKKNDKSAPKRSEPMKKFDIPEYNEPPKKIKGKVVGRDRKLRDTTK